MTQQIKRPLGPLAEKMGVEITRLDDECCICEMPVDGNTQPIGILHGGANGVLGETAGSVLAVHHAPPGWRALGARLEMNHRKPVREGTVNCKATLESSEGRKRWYRLECRNEWGETYAEGRLLTVDIEHSG